MFRDITVGQYYAIDSPVHELDPRTKLLGTLIYIVVLFAIQQPILYIPCFIFLLCIYSLAKVPFRYLLKGLQGIVILLFFTFVFRMLCTPGTELARGWIFTITKQGVFKAIKLTSRIALMIAGASLLSYTTTPREMSDGLETSLSFLEKLRIPIHEMAVIVMIAFRFIPIMIEEMNVLIDAQAARGVEFEHCSVFKKCKNVFSLLLPLFLSTVRRSSDLAMAMEARGYKGEGETSRMYPLVYKATDRKAYVTMILFALCMIGATIAIGIFL